MAGLGEISGVRFRTPAGICRGAGQLHTARTARSAMRSGPGTAGMVSARHGDGHHSRSPSRTEPLDAVVPRVSNPHRPVRANRDANGTTELPGTRASPIYRLPRHHAPPPVGIPHLDPVVLISGTARGKRYRGHGGVSVSGGFPSPSSGQRPLPAAQQPVPARRRPRMSSLKRTCTETHPAPVNGYARPGPVCLPGRGLHREHGRPCRPLAPPRPRLTPCLQRRGRTSHQLRVPD